LVSVSKIEEEMIKAVTTWILVADGARAKVYQNKGPGTGLAETRFPEMVGMHEPTRSINADREGYNVQGTMVHSADPHREQKRTFARDVAEFLERQVQARAFDRLVLVAPAKTLGDLRSALDDDVANRVVSELAKDLTHANVRDLPKHLEDVLAL
jgi:protein required for attachment to host cells